MSSQNSPISPGPPGLRRTVRSPVRHTPYTHGSHPSRSGMENLHLPGSSFSSDLGELYAPYNSSSTGGYERTPFAPVPNYDAPRRMPALTTMVNVDEISNEYGLDKHQRKAAHSFAKLSSDDRSIALFLRLLQMEQQTKGLREDVHTMRADVEAIGAFCMQSWAPSKQQTKLMKALLRHYMIQPITSYNNLVAIVEIYIHDHAKRLHLELFKRDPTVKSVVHELLAAENNCIRSTLRKVVFASVQEKTALHAFSRKIINGYHLPDIPAKPPQDIMACLAFMREVAWPLVDKNSTRGGNTGFWISVEKTLDKLFEENGNKRDDPKWRQWEEKIIAEDNRRYLRCGAETNALSREELDAVGVSAPPSVSTPGPLVDEDEEASETLERRDISISGLGNLAALTVAPVVRNA